MKASVTIEIERKGLFSRTDCKRCETSRFIIDFALLKQTENTNVVALIIPVEEKTLKSPESIVAVYKRLKSKSVKPFQLSLFE